MTRDIADECAGADRKRPLFGGGRQACRTPPNRVFDRREFLAISGMLAASGCARNARAINALTSWTEAECAALDQSLANSFSSQRFAVRWERVSPAGRLARSLGSNHGFDLILGGPIDSITKPSLSQRPAFEFSGSIERSPVGLAFGRGTLGTPAWIDDSKPIDLTDSRFADRLVLCDPRVDAATAAWTVAMSKAAPWHTAFATLVKIAANARRIIPHAGLAFAGGASGRCALAFRDCVSGDENLEFAELPNIDRREGIALVQGGSNIDLAREWLAAATKLGRVSDVVLAGEFRESATARRLLLDLLGAAIVDAHSELRAARLALEEKQWPEPLARALIQPPTWPPVSVRVLGERLALRGESPVAYLGTLAAQLASDHESEAWLLESWQRDVRPIDSAALREIARVSGGRLALNPRFRTWLRGEWAATARQRFRRVARRALG